MRKQNKISMKRADEKKRKKRNTISRSSKNGTRQRDEPKQNANDETRRKGRVVMKSKLYL